MPVRISAYMYRPSSAVIVAYVVTLCRKAKILKIKDAYQVFVHDYVGCLWLAVATGPGSDPIGFGHRVASLNGGRYL